MKKFTDDLSFGNGRATEAAARVTHSNFSYVSAAKSVREKAPELIDEIRSGKLTIPDARILAKLPSVKRKDILRQIKQGKLVNGSVRARIEVHLSEKRKASDLYETPYSMTEQLLEREKFAGTILEPSCGNGAIAQFFQNIVSQDIDDGHDFLKERKRYDNIITNPPFSLAFEFILKAKELARKKIAMLLPISYLHGQERYEQIWTDKSFPLARLYVFTRYPMLGDELRDDGKYRTGMMVYAWFIWNKCHRGEPVIRWIDNNKYVLNGADGST